MDFLFGWAFVHDASNFSTKKAIKLPIFMLTTPGHWPILNVFKGDHARQKWRFEMTNLKPRLTALVEATSLAGLPAATEKQVDFIATLMARKNITVAYFSSSDMLTKRGASNAIDSLKVIQQGVC